MHRIPRPFLFRHSMAIKNRRRTIRNKQGMCGVCGEPICNSSARTMCRKCARKHSRQVTRRRVGLKKEGNCVHCRKPRGENGTKTYCRPCADKHAAHVNQYRQSIRKTGLCYCGKPPEPGFKFCKPCRISISLQRQTKLQKGQA